MKLEQTGRELRDGSLTVDVLRTVDEVSGFTSEWSSFLDSRSPEHTVFQHPAFVLSELLTRPDYEPAVLAVRDAGTLVSIVPGFIQKVNLGVRVSVLGPVGPRGRVLRVFGSAAVFDPAADAARCLSLAMAALERARLGIAVVALDQLEIAGATWRALEQTAFAPAGHRFRRVSSGNDLVHRIRFPASHDAYVRGLTSNARNQLKRRVNKLQNLCSSLEVQETTRPEDVPAFLRSADHIFSRSWQAGAFGSRRRDSAGETIKTEMWARAGWLRGFVLADGDRPLAFVTGLQYRGVFHYLETAYDQAFASSAPGLVLQYLMLAHLFQHRPPAIFDFGYGDNQQKRMLANEHAEGCDARLVRHRSWQLLIDAQRAVDGLERRIRTTLKRLGADAAVRHLLKRSTTR